MTSTTFSGKLKQGRSFFLWSLFTGKTTMIIYLSLLTFFSMVIFVFGFGITASVPDEADQIWNGAAMFTIIITQALAFIFTFVFSIKEFSYLHDKRKTDMFGSLPSSRRTIFFSKLAAVIVQSTVPMLIIMTFLAIMNGEITNLFSLKALFEIDTEPHMINLWYYMLRGFTGLVVNAVFMGFLSICCGKTVDKVLTYIIINAAYPVAALLVQLMPSSFVIGYSVDINEFFTCALSPYLSMITINPIYWGAFAIVLGVLCFVLIPRRKAECAQSHFAFKAPLIITKVLVSFAAGMVLAYMFGFVFSMLSGDIIAFVIGWLLGSFTAYFVIQIIFAKGFRGFGKGLIPYAALVVFFGALMLVLNTGMFGYESYIPKADEVESVRLVDGEMLYGNDKIGRITDKKQIEDCINGHKEALEFRRNANFSIGEKTFGGSFKSVEYEYEEGGVVALEYRLKNGMTVKRNYGYFNSRDIGFIATPTYTINTNDLFLNDPKYANEVYFEESYDGEGSEYFEEEYDQDQEITEYNIIIDEVKYNIDDDLLNDKKFITKLIEALKKDMLAQGTKGGEAVCEITFYYDNKSDMYGSEDIAITTLRSTYKNTLEVLKKNCKAVSETKTKI